MKILRIEELMRHLRVDGEEEKEYIESLGEAAEEVVEKYLNRTMEDVEAMEGRVPQSIVHACLLIVADLYRNREASSQVQVYGNPALMTLLRPHKRLV